MAEIPFSNNSRSAENVSTMQRPGFKPQQSLRQKVSLTDNRFDVNTLPKDLQRVYLELEHKHGEDHALVFVFSVRTGVELHRAWHMTMLTSKILQQIKDKFNMHMTWDLGVIKLKFRVSDGGNEIQRKVPYDYDSEFQDLYMKIAVALIEDRINIHQALNFQSETKQGLHTAKTGNFLRHLPGRLVLYPIEAATCAMIFFGGDLTDAGIAAVCGVAAGLIEYAMSSIGGDAKVLIDVLVGTSTGIIGGLFYRYNGEEVCLSAVFMGTLYWFFYGTAFVIGILEIISGSLETGVVRFMAVSVKTFVLTLGATFGLQLTLLKASEDAWLADKDNCNNLDLDTVWWRIPLYILCSASALGQYRFPIADYWRGLIVQLVGYEIQYATGLAFEVPNSQSLLDTATSNICAAAGSVVAAHTLSFIFGTLSFYYNARLLQRDYKEFSLFGEFMFKLSVGYVRLTNCLGVGRRNDLTFLNMSEELRKASEELSNPHHARTEIKLTLDEERILTEAVIGAEDINVWALLMPTVYQLVPGSLIARLWFNSIFPVQFIDEEKEIENSGGLKYMTSTYNEKSGVFSNLMVVATTLALGLLIGMGIVHAITYFWKRLTSGYSSLSASSRARNGRRQERYGIMGSVPDDDPDDDEDNADYSAIDNNTPKTDALSPRLTSVEEIEEGRDISIPTGNSCNTADNTNLIYGEDI